MKILHILDHSIPLHSGYAFRTLALIEHQRQLGWETFHITSAKHYGASAAVEVVDGISFYRTEVASAWWASLPVLNQWAVIKTLQRRLEQVVEQIQPDILHAHSPALNGMAALAVAKKYRLPLVYECRAFWEDAAVDHGKTRLASGRYRLSKAMETHVFKRADAVTTICQGLRGDIISRGIAAEKVTVIANGVDIEQFKFGEPADVDLQQQLQLLGMKVLGFFGSFYDYEGLLLLLDALPKIIERQPNLRLLLAGGGPQLPQIEDRIAELNLQQRVILLGRVPHQQMHRYYNLVDLFVYPRLPTRLTELVTPLKSLEAMAQGRLLLASDVGGHRELISDGETGYLFKAGDRDDLVEKVLQVFADQAHWQQIRRAGRRYVEQERGWRQSVDCYRQVYGKLLSGSQ
jgi:PEP-CTERM/exosortase A-associated glycosyltransferase